MYRYYHTYNPQFPVQWVLFHHNQMCLVHQDDKRIKERTPPKKQGVGRPPIDPADIAKILLLQAYTSSPDRVAEGSLHLFREKLGVHRHFSYKTMAVYQIRPHNKLFC